MKTSKPEGESSGHVIDRDLAPPVSITPKKGPKKISPREKRNIMIENVTQVLVKTTVMPFRWLKSSYRCFYCYDIFQEPSDLKEHQVTHVGDEVKEKAMKKYWEEVVYVDISEMSCRLCPEEVTDLYDMIDHLVAKHDTVYNKDIGICMVAFKLDNFNVSCLACGANFLTFGPLLYHTNKHHKGTSVILCDVCGQHFKDNILLRMHVRTVHENTGLLCPDCGDKFDTRSKLKTHQKNQHDLANKYKCLVCTQTFQSHYKRSRHMAAEHKNRKEIKCLHCPKTFVFRSMMVTHVRDTHLKVRNHVCGVCGWRAFNSNRLKNHMYKHSGEKNFKCDSCDKAFTTKKIMKAHFARMHKVPSQTIPHGNEIQNMPDRWRKEQLVRLLTVILENSTVMAFRYHSNRYMCFYCGCPFTDSNKLKEHNWTEHSDMKIRSTYKSLLRNSRVKLEISNIKCKLCSQGFNKIFPLVDHLADIHSLKTDPQVRSELSVFKLDENKMVCVECDEEFRFFATLLKHYHAYHNKSELYICEICGVGFVAKCNVQSHIRNVHNSSSSHSALKCPHCPLTFSSSYMKKRHLILTHNIKVVQYSCTQCPRNFATRSRLVAHEQRTHLKQKSFACEFCGYRAFNRHGLSLHMVSHNDSRPFECDFCKKAFQRKKTLEIHRRIHTNDKRCVCKMCGKAFVQTASLKLHYRVHHPKDSEDLISYSIDNKA